MNPFAWLRRKAAEAVIQGVADGVAAVGPADEAPPDLDGLRQQLAERLAMKALPAAIDPAPAPKRRASS